MAMTKKELIEFLNELVELASEENKTKAVSVKEKFISDFEKSYGYEKEVITEITKLPPHYIAAMPDAVQEEIRQKVREVHGKDSKGVRIPTMLCGSCRAVEDFAGACGSGGYRELDH